MFTQFFCLVPSPTFMSLIFDSLGQILVVIEVWSTKKLDLLSHSSWIEMVLLSLVSSIHLNNIANNLISDSKSPKLWEKTFVVLSHPVCYTLLWQLLENYTESKTELLILSPSPKKSVALQSPQSHLIILTKYNEIHFDTVFYHCPYPYFN